MTVDSLVFTAAISLAFLPSTVSTQQMELIQTLPCVGKWVRFPSAFPKFQVPCLRNLATKVLILDCFSVTQLSVVNIFGRKQDM